MPRCKECGRPLIRPSPSGMGPVCARRRGATPSRSPTIRSTNAPTDPMPGQTELPLHDHQPTKENT